MMRLPIAKLRSLASSTRHCITLSDDSTLVLFRLPALASNQHKQHIARHDDVEYYLMQEECPHAGGPMSDATIELDDVEDTYMASCPWHHYDFNLDTGESKMGIKACTYPLQIENGKLYMVVNTDALQVKSVEPVSEEFIAPKTKPMERVADDIDGADNLPVRVTGIEYLSDDASLTSWCVHILNTSQPEHKIQLTHYLWLLYTTREATYPMQIGSDRPPDEPPRDALLKVVHPGSFKGSGRAGNVKHRVAMLHSLANIEQWAIDLALDIMARFSHFKTSRGTCLPRQFFHDWLKVANDEAKHFSLLRGRLEHDDLGNSSFGALPVHHGLWQSAQETSHDLRARISIVALVHEARGLDINPMTIGKFERSGDKGSVDVLRIIHRDEVTHVTTGHRWLTWICEDEETDPVNVFRSNVKKYFRGSVKGPFNQADRQTAGLDADWYANLEGTPKTVLIAGG
ncbi:hypothetical protein BCR37DRAFT_297849 [Protomyces lactucae-debilis]|uniref:Rieske domain-containing protein n=1 Tax=Protomyces lactucae-debilis TaxID=2754530 RepID=A0A1Y2FGV2_PROLT|nr:uncharacterized protein BCR37DRAFT_297849 [Protomyces lactucae-debilis]ORY83171.1 hypothetical protein BCR37DRAFT_297849 [Protomyces lactucae-debilis]